MDTNKYCALLDEDIDLLTPVETDFISLAEDTKIENNIIDEDPFTTTITKVKQEQSIIDFLSTRYKKDIKKVIGNKLIKDNLSTCLVIALQVELNKKGANLLVDGKFYGDTKTAYALKKKELVQKGTDSIFVLIWKYILSQKGSQYQCTNMNTYFDDECDKFTREYQKRIKTTADGIVGFSVLAEALKF